MILYNLENDIGERNDLSKEYPQIVAILREFARTARNSMSDEDYNLAGNRPGGFIANPKPLIKKSPVYNTRCKLDFQI